MILTAHQPCYLPWVGFFAKAASADAFIFMDWVQLDYRSWQTRNRLLSANGPFYITVPVSIKGQSRQAIRDTEIDYSRDWRSKHLRSIQQNYSKAPFFRDYFPRVEALLAEERKYLGELNTASVELLLDFLDIKTEILPGDKFNFKESKMDLVVEMCAATGAEGYISSDGERGYILPERLEAIGVEHRYLNYEHPIYQQRYEPFTPYMSALDLLFNCGPDSRDILLAGVGKAKYD
jgi:hypothetical protein